VARIDPEAADVYISNFAFENAVLFRRANVLGMVNPLVVEQAADGLAQTYSSAHAAGDSVPTLLLPANLAVQISAVANPVSVATAATPGFQVHHARGASIQSTVTYFLLQVAFWVGYKRVTLIGVDNTYNQPDVAEGVVITQSEADTNHFSSDYFRGRRWEAADTDRMAAVISLAATAYNAHGRVLMNSTDGGALEVVPRRPLAEVLRNAIYGLAPLTLSRRKVCAAYVRSFLSFFRSRRAFAITLLFAVILAVVAVALSDAYVVHGGARAAGVGAALCLCFAIAIAVSRFWERNGELSNLHEFEQRSRGVFPAEQLATPDQLSHEQTVPGQNSSERK